MSRLHTAALAAVAGSMLAGIFSSPGVAAETYPSRPITIIVPFAPGAVADLVARIVADRMRVTLGQPIIIEDVIGAGSTIGVGRAVRAAPDGYTLNVGDLTSHVSSSAIFPVKYDLLRDLEPVALLSTAPQLFVGRTNLPARDLRELIEWLKANPDDATLGIPGNFGNGGHLSGLSFQNSTGARLRFIPHRTSPEAVQDVIGGHVDLLFTDAANVLPFVRSGQVKAYGVTTATRWTTAPDIPTLEEFGVPLQFSLWRGLWAPANTPKNVVGRLNAAAVEALADPAVRQRLAEIGNDIFPTERQSPEALRAHHQAEIDKWWPIIKAANIKPE